MAAPLAVIFFSSYIIIGYCCLYFYFTFVFLFFFHYKGTFDNERVKQGEGTYVWMGPASEDDPDTLVEKARYTGNYKDGQKHGVGKMIYPNGDIYEGEWVENRMEGEGSYTYKTSNDIYSGSWVNNKKSGQGTYSFGKDQSIMTGTWENGQITTGKWALKGYAEYEGGFKLGRPFGQGKFAFTNGLTQTGSFDEKARGEDEEPPAEDEVVPPNTSWVGDSIVAF